MKFEVGAVVRAVEDVQGAWDRLVKGERYRVVGEFHGFYNMLNVVGPDGKVSLGWYDFRFELAPPLEAPDTNIGQLQNVLLDVIAERRRQDAKFGKLGGCLTQSHAERMCVLTEEVGEAAKEVNELKQPGAKQRLREELVQVAAVAVLLVQCLDIEEE